MIVCGVVSLALFIINMENSGAESVIKNELPEYIVIPPGVLIGANDNAKYFYNFGEIIKLEMNSGKCYKLSYIHTFINTIQTDFSNKLCNIYNIDHLSMKLTKELQDSGVIENVRKI